MISFTGTTTAALANGCRALPDAELDAFVDALAVRIASFDKSAIAEPKNFVDAASLPPDAELGPEWGRMYCLDSALRQPDELMERGFHKAGDVESRLGYYVGQLGG